MTIFIKKNIFRFEVTVNNIFLMKMFDSKTQFSGIESGLFFRKSNLSGKMKTEISSWAIVKSKIEIVRSLKGKMKIDDKLMIRLFEYVSFNNSVLELFLKNKILFLQSLESIELIIGNESS